MIDQTLYRDILGQFATGVVVVTTNDEQGGITGLTVNAFSAVSMDPALVMVCPQKTSLSYQDLLKSKKFAIHILHKDQQDLAWTFAKKDVDSSDISWHQGEHGSPILDDCLAVIECSLWQNYDGGDHDIVVGEIIAMSKNDSSDKHSPLLFHCGKMITLD